MIHEVKVPLLRIAALQRGGIRDSSFDHLFWCVHGPCDEPMAWLIVLGLIIPEHELSQAIALARCAGELKRCVYNIWLKPELLVGLRHKEGVSTSEYGCW